MREDCDERLGFQRLIPWIFEPELPIAITRRLQKILHQVAREYSFQQAEYPIEDIMGLRIVAQEFRNDHHTG